MKLKSKNRLLTTKCELLEKKCKNLQEQLDGLRRRIRDLERHVPMEEVNLFEDPAAPPKPEPFVLMCLLRRNDGHADCISLDVEATDTI
jgi:hypothetical protein